MAASQRCCVLSCSGDGEFDVSGDQLNFAKSAGGGRGSAKQEDLSYAKQGRADAELAPEERTISELAVADATQTVDDGDEEGGDEEGDSSDDEGAEPSRGASAAAASADSAAEGSASRPTRSSRLRPASGRNTRDGEPPPERKRARRGKSPPASRSGSKRKGKGGGV